MVVEARVSTVTSAHQDSTGICADSSWLATLRRSCTSASMRAKLCTSATLPSASEARSARPSSAPRPRSACRRSCARRWSSARAKTTHSTNSRIAEPPVQVQRQRQQHDQRDDRRRSARGRSRARCATARRCLAASPSSAGPNGRRCDRSAAAAGCARNSSSAPPAAADAPAGRHAARRTAPQTIVNRPKPTQAPSSGQIVADTVARVPAAWLFDSASMIQPNRTGSANCATASSTLATASSQPSRASDPSNSSTRP